MNCDEFRVHSAPPSAFYIPNFLTDAEEAHILQQVQNAPKPKWTQLKTRRLQDYGGTPHAKGMIVERMPAWLNGYVRKVAKYFPQEFQPNQVLVNEYQPHQGILPHTDGALFHPLIATLSCGAPTILDFVENDEKRQPVSQLLLERKSLVLIGDDLYEKYLHGIAEVDVQRIGALCANLGPNGLKIGEMLVRSEVRVSLTVRSVLKCIKLRL